MLQFQLLQSHSYCTHYIFEKSIANNQTICFFYQSADKDYQRNYFHHYLRKTTLFSEISENF